MKKFLICLFVLFLLPLNNFAQTYTAAPYCSPVYSQFCTQPGPSNMPGNFVNDFIHNFITIGGNANISNLNSGCGPYVYNCHLYLATMPSQVITCSIQIGNIYAQGIALFVDWNQDNVFATASETVAATPATIAGGAWTTLTFTVPPAQPNGIYRLRARCVRSTPGTLISPCNSYAFGEAEDYQILVGIPAPGPTTITASQTTVCPVSVVSLSATGGGPYLWSNGQTQPNTSIAVSQNTVIYISVQQAGCAVINAVSLTAVPLVSVTTTPFVNICMGSTTTLTASGANSYTWNPGGIVSSTIAVSPTITTVYNVTGSNGFCFQNVSTTVTPMPQITINNSQSICCIGSTVNMSANGALNYTWMPGNIIGPFASFSPIATSNFTLIGESGICTSTKTFQIIVPPSPTIIPSSNLNPSCVGAVVTLSASGGNSYTWNPGGVGNTVAVTPTTQSIYTVTGNDGTCSATALITQSVMPGPTVTATSNSIIICSGTQVTLSANGAPFYLWSNGNSNSSIVITPSATVSYTVTGILGICTGSAVVIQSVIPTPSITTVSSMSVICVGNTATLTANGASSYSWLPSGNGSSIVISPTITSTYTVNGSNGPCTSSASITQSVDLCTAIAKNNLLNFESKLYPNPFDNKIIVSAINFDELIITDLIGQQIMIIKNDSIENINTSNWLPGLYFFRFQMNSEIKTLRLLKN